MTCSDTNENVTETNMDALYKVIEEFPYDTYP